MNIQPPQMNIQPPSPVQFVTSILIRPSIINGSGVHPVSIQDKPTHISTYLVLSDESELWISDNTPNALGSVLERAAKLSIFYGVPIEGAEGLDLQAQAGADPALVHPLNGQVSLRPCAVVAIHTSPNDSVEMKVIAFDSTLLPENTKLWLYHGPKPGAGRLLEYIS